MEKISFKNLSRDEALSLKASLEKEYAVEDRLEERIKQLNEILRKAKKAHDYKKVEATKKKIASHAEELKIQRAGTKAIVDSHVYFARAAKPYLDAEKLLNQKENYSHFDEINALYTEAKYRNDKAIEKARIERERKMAAEKAENDRIKAEKAAAKLAKKEKATAKKEKVRK